MAGGWMGMRAAVGRALCAADAPEGRAGSPSGDRAALGWIAIGLVAGAVLAPAIGWAQAEAVAASAPVPGSASAARVVLASPQGSVSTPVSQLRLRFDRPVVAAGDVRAADPVRWACSGLPASAPGSTPAGSGRWNDEREWVFHLAQPLPPGVRCEAQLREDWRPLGTAGGASSVAGLRWSFSTAGPVVVQVRPWPGSSIDERQHWVLVFNGPPQPASVKAASHCAVQGVADRIPVRLVEGAEREATIAAQGFARLGARAAADLSARTVVLACERPLPPEAAVRLTVAPGVVSADSSALASRQGFSEGWKVRPAFQAEFTCERERAGAPCWPVRPLRLEFSAPLARADAARIRLVAVDGGTPPAAAQVEGGPQDETVQGVAFSPPLAENARYRIELPADLRDDSGRLLANADRFPLAVATGEAPPLAKFAAAPFGILERGLAEPAAGRPEGGRAPAGVLPITLRHVQSDWPAAGATRATTAPAGPTSPGVVRTMRLTDPAEVLAWHGRLQRHHEQWMSAREAGRPRSEWFRTELETDAQGRERPVQRERLVGTREVSLLRADSPVATGRIEPAPRRPGQPPAPAPAPPPALREVTPLSLPPLPGPAASPRPFEVVGLPLAEPGYHVVEVESARLGQALLDPAAPMYVRTGVLVTNLGVHVKHGRESSVVWVTSLDRGRPVAGVDVTVHDCRGTPLWSGATDARGLARIDQPLDPRPPAQRSALAAGRYDEAHAPAARCTSDEGLFVVARQRAPGAASGAPPVDFAFAFSSWQRGIEPWRFELPTGEIQDRFTPEARAHTVFDRTLLRAGETVSMKHFLRLETARGLALPAADALPDGAVLTHLGSGQEMRVPITWQGSRSATSSWAIPAGARLGTYSVALERRVPARPAPPATAAGPDRVERWPSGDFRVEAFRVPLIEARLVPPAQVAPGARELPLAVSVQYLSGGGMAQSQARVSALLSPRVPRFDAWPGFRFDAPRPAGEPGDPAAGLDELDADGAREPGRVVASGLAAPTDRLGAGQVLLRNLPAITEPSTLLAELSVDDPNGERQSTAVSVPLWPSDRVLGLQVPGFGRVGEPLALKVLALDTAGRAQAGQSVVVKAIVRQTFSVRKRLVGGFYSYDNRTELQDLGTVCEGRSDARGLLACDAKLPRGGELELVASTADAQGRVARAAARVWVSGEADAWFAQDDDDRITLLPERTRYAPGETARIQVRMPFREATALVAVEREGVIDTRLVRLRAERPVIELPIEADWAPNVVVSVIALRGRVREVPWMSFLDWGWKAPLEWWRARRDEAPQWRAPTAQVDLARPSFKFGATGLSIGTEAQALQVTVTTPRPDYKVRETAEARIRVTQGGKPLAEPQTVELAFAAIDEGLLALRPNASWDLLGALMRERPWSVSTASGHSEIVGRRHYGRKAVAPGGGGGVGTTRELFDTALVWRARVTLDTRGEAVVPVPLNDSLTSFRLVAVADALSGDGRMAFGRGEATIRVNQDLQLLPGLPLAVREGDRFDARVTLRNTTSGPMALQVSMAADAAAAWAAPPPQAVDLPPGGTQELAFTVQVPEGLAATRTQIEWTLLAQERAGAGGAAPRSDRVRRTQALLPAVPLRVWQASVRPLDAAFDLAMATPAGALADAGRPRGGVQVGLQASLAQGLPGLRRWFEAYPFSCLEQQASRAIGLADAARWEALMTAWPTYLDEDGLAGYFPAGPGSAATGSDRLTAYLVSAAHAAGLALPAVVLDPMLAGLSAFVEGRLQRPASSFGGSAESLDRDVRRLAALEALSRHGRVRPQQLSVLRVAPSGWPTSALLDWIAVLQRVERAPQRAERLAQAQLLLRERVVASGTRLGFTQEASDSWWWLMEHPDANAARLLLQAVDDPAWQDDLPRLVAGHLARQRDGAWATTTANAWSAVALRRFAERFESQPVQGRTQATLADAAAQHDWAAGPGAAGPEPLMLPWPASRPAASPAVLQVRHEGRGRPWVSVQSIAAVPLTAPVQAGYRLRRTVTPVEVREAGRLSRGDVVRVQLEIDASEGRTWVALADPLPAGATVLGSGLGGDSVLAQRSAGVASPSAAASAATPRYVERTPDQWRAYFDELPRGRHVVSYTLRLNHPGRFSLPPTRVEAMYAPETFGELPNAAVEVKP